jgi:FtsH-binding integral membrane protein
MDALLSNAVFKRTAGTGTLSARAFYGVLGIMLILGLVLAIFAAQYAIRNDLPINGWMVLLLGLALPIAGIVISKKSKTTIVSFLGYLLLIIPMGIVLGVVLRQYDTQTIFRTALLTGGVVVLMALLAFLWPSWFEGIGKSLFVTLLCLLAVRILQVFIPSWQNLRWIDYLAAGLFALYVGWDLYRAQKVDRTVRNAIDIAMALFLDIINLFLNLLKR